MLRPRRTDLAGPQDDRLGGVMRLGRGSSSGPLDLVSDRLSRQRAVVFRVDDGDPDWLLVRDTTLDAVAELGSVTKVLTALALVSSDHDPGDSVAATLGRPDDIEVDGRSLSLGDLATHHGGVPRLPRQLLRADPRDPYRDTTVESVMAEFGSWAAEDAADAERAYAYSNFGFAALGHALAGRETTWSELVRSSLDRLAPGAEIWTDGPPRGSERAPARSRRGREVPWWTMGGYSPAGGAVGSARGLASFARAVLRAHSDPSDELHGLVQDWTRTRHRIGEHAGIALGWHVIGDDSDPVLWHNGATGGSTAFVALRPARRRAVGLLASGPPDDEVERAVGRMLVDAERD